MNIENFLDRLTDYLDGLMPEKERKQFEAYLAECEECQQIVNSFRAIRERLRETPVVNAPAEAKVRLYEALNAERARRGEPLLRIPAELLAQVRARAKAAAEAAQQQARAALEEYEKSLAEARVEAQRMLDETRPEQGRLAAELKTKAERELGEMRDKAKREIESAKKQALNELYNESVNLATVMAGKILAREVTVDDQQKLMDESLAEMKSANC